MRLTDLPEDPSRIDWAIRRVWGTENQEIPPELLRALRHAGACLQGAEADGELVGFALGFLAWGDGLHVHSHMLGVVPGWRGRGVGVALKLAQRAECLDRGVPEMRWTYDPLIATNARLNLNRLGCVATAFLPNFYGEMRDRLNAGDRSDRFEVRWRLESDRVERALAGSGPAVPRGETMLRAVGGPGRPRPEPAAAAPPRSGALVQIPGDFFGLRSEDPDLGARWRRLSGAAFGACFGAGLVATGLGSGPTYVFEAVGDVE